MATFDRPSLVPTWAENNQTNVVQPPDSLRDVGYVGNEVPMAEHLNWLFWEYGNWLGYLDQANAATVMATTLDVNTRLVGGGTWSYNANTSTLSWSQAAGLLIPSIPLSDNNIAAGSVILGEDTVAYVQANVPYTTTGGLTSGSSSVVNVPHPAAIAVGQVVTGTGIPANTTVTAINDSTLTLSQAATATNATATLTFAGNGGLTVQAATASSLLPSPNTVILAIGKANTCIVGANSGQMLLRHNEAKSLLGTGYVSTMPATAGVALTANQAVYVSQGSADGRTSGAVYPCDASSSNGAQRGQFIGFAINAYSAGATAHVVSSGVVNQFTGLSVGQVYYLDPANVGGITTTRPTAAGLFVVPVGCAITATSLRISPMATNALQALQNGLTVNGPLVVKPGQSGNALQIYSADGSTVNASVTDAGAAAFSSASATTLVASNQISSQGPVFGSSFYNTSGFKSVIQAGMFYDSNYTTTSPPTYEFTFVPQVDQSGNVTRMIWQQVMTHPGSLIGASFISNSATSNANDYAYMLPYISGQSCGALQPAMPAAAANYRWATVTPGTYSFKAGDILTVKIYINSSPSHTGSYNFTCWLTLALNAY